MATADKYHAQAKLDRPPSAGFRRITSRSPITFELGWIAAIVPPPAGVDPLLAVTNGRYWVTKIDP